MPKRRTKRHLVTQPCDESYRLIPLTRNQNAIVDTENFEYLSQFNWQAHWNPSSRSFYAVRHLSAKENKGLKILMHREIMNCKLNDECDHKNRNTLDDRRSNLRLCTRNQNNANMEKHANNTSGFKGVFFFKYSKAKKWRAQIRVNDKSIALGYFRLPEEAARAYDAAAKFYYGEFAHTNF